jgi:hypothetical protein
VATSPPEVAAELHYTRTAQATASVAIRLAPTTDEPSPLDLI